MTMAAEIPSLERANHYIKVARLKCLGDRVLLRRYEEQNEKLVVTPDKFKVSNRGEVLSVGEKVETVKKGDRVLFGEYSAQEIEIDGEELILISIHDIWLKL